MKRHVGTILLTIVALLAGAELTRSQLAAEMPAIPDAMTPHNGAVAEYWPNQQLRSERVYRDGQIQKAVYYSSAGSIVFEMCSKSSD